MGWWLGFLVILIALWGLLRLKVYLWMECQEGRRALKVRLGGWTLFALPGKPRREKRPGAKRKGKKQKKKTKKRNYGVQEWWALIQGMIPHVLQLLQQVKEGLQVERFHLSILLGGDPAEAFFLYGGVCSLWGVLWTPMVEQLSIQDGSVHVDVQLDSPEPVVVEGELSMAWRLGSLLRAGIQVLWHGVLLWFQVDRTYRKEQNRKRKVD